MKFNQEIGTNPTNTSISLLNAVLDELIPFDLDKKMPSLVELGASRELLIRPENRWLNDALFQLNELSNKKYKIGFSELTGNDRATFISENASFWNEIIARIGPLALIFYFQNEIVINALGLEFRPPFPNGHTVSGGNWDMLEPVYLRGQIYRDVQ